MSTLAKRIDLDPTTLDRTALLTPKERACLTLVASHHTSQEIARQLRIKKSSVDTYCDRARTKLMVSDRYDAALYVQAAMAANDDGGSAAPASQPPAPWVYWVCSVTLISFAFAAFALFVSTLR